MKHKHLAETCEFRLSLAVPLVSAAALGALIAFNEGFMSLCFQSVCVQTFFTIYKFPIAIAGLCLPLVALVAAIQRSKEAAVQIEYASRQLDEVQLNNRFGNYLKHREGFDKLISDHCAQSNAAIDRGVYFESPTVYNKLFPGSGFNNPSWVGSCDEVVMKGYDEKVSRLLAELARSKDEFDIVECVDALRDLVRSLRVGYGKCKVVRYKKKDGSPQVFNVSSIFDDRFCLIACMIDVLEIYNLVSAYAGRAGNYEPALIMAENEALEKVVGSLSKISFSKPPSYSNLNKLEG